MIALILILVGLVVLVSAVRPHTSSFSAYERKRRAGDGGTKQERDVLRHQTHLDIQFWLDFKELVLVLGLILLAIQQGGLVRGVLMGVGIIFIYKIVANLSLVRRLAQRLYDRYESYIFRAAVTLQPVSKLMRPSTKTIDFRPASREELLHLIETSSRFFDQEEFDLLKSALQFRELIVRDYMTPRESVDTVSVTELLGPLVLNDLHKTGHHQFPVIDGDIDHILGVLDVENLLIAGDKTSPRVRSAMDARVCYVNQAQTLDEALIAFVQTKRHLLIVVNDTEETVGILSLGDVISALTGHVVGVRNPDEYENLRAIAAKYTIEDQNID